MTTTMPKFFITVTILLLTATFPVYEASAFEQAPYRSITENKPAPATGFSTGNKLLNVVGKSETVEEDSDQIGPGAQNFVSNMAQRALDFLGDPDLDQDKKTEEFRKLLEDSFDMSTLGRFSLGRYWRVSTPQQRKEYQKLFKKMIIGIYASRFKDYKGQKFETRSFRLDGTKDTIVTSFIIPDKGAEIQIDWRVRYKKGRYQIIDVIVEGVSMSVTQRSDFSAVIQRGGGNVQVLLEHLKEH